jgi:hypothetical protein
VRSLVQWSCSWYEFVPNVQFVALELRPPVRVPHVYTQVASNSSDLAAAPKEMGIVLGIAVLLDTFVVRLVLVPVLLRLAGASAWHVPRWADRILPDVRVGQSPSGCRGLPAPRHM